MRRIRADIPAMTAPKRDSLLKAHAYVADARDALRDLEEDIYLLQSGQSVACEADYTRLRVDRLEAAARGLGELLVAGESEGSGAAGQAIQDPHASASPPAISPPDPAEPHT